MENLLDDVIFDDGNYVDVVREIEKVKSESGLNYIACVVEVSEKFNLDIEQLSDMLPKNIKEKIEADALELNLLTYKLNTLV